MKNHRILGLFYGLCWQNTVTKNNCILANYSLEKDLELLRFDRHVIVFCHTKAESRS